MVVFIFVDDAVLYAHSRSKVVVFFLFGCAFTVTRAELVFLMFLML